MALTLDVSGISKQTLVSVTVDTDEKQREKALRRAHKHPLDFLGKNQSQVINQSTGCYRQTRKARKGSFTANISRS